jgi:DNA helicase II / ATP-dependent DNA helicase PcrA
MASTIPNSNFDLDDHVDVEIAACLDMNRPKSFFMFAGAGSGKTRSLANALRHIEKAYGTQLRLSGRRVAVITYTNAARDEIMRRVKSDAIFNVRTIHSFAWELIGNFHADIREWLRGELVRDIAELRDLLAKGRQGTKAAVNRQEQIESKSRRLANLDQIRVFTYNPTGDNRERNALNHSEVIKICASFLMHKPLMCEILVNQYPFLLIDESQDTNKLLVDALMAVEESHQGRFSLGLLGDTMQRIYNEGKEKIEAALPARWEKPAKKLNHRSPRRIIQLINQIRGQVDDHEQEPRSDAIDGYVRMFVFPANVAEPSAKEDMVRAQMATITGDGAWKTQDQCKILTLEHMMAARRMGFDKMFEPLYQVDDLRTGLLDGTLGATRFFTHTILPLVTARQRGDEFGTMRAVRDNSPLLKPDAFDGTTDPLEPLKRAQDAVASLLTLWETEEPTCGDILENVAASGLFDIPDSLQPMLRARQAPDADGVPQADNTDPEADTLPEREVALGAFLEAPFSQIAPYASYVSDKAPFGTHQGVKGLEFDRVMVVMADEESRGFLFGYDKLLGSREPTAADLKNEREGKETSVDRTRRLLYVTCSRARKSLALVAYTENPDSVKAHLIESGWFREDEIVVGV